MFESLLNIWQNNEPSLEFFICYWAHFHCFKWANMEKLIKPTGHTGPSDRQANSLFLTNETEASYKNIDQMRTE